jgi:hypothetical protein
MLPSTRIFDRLPSDSGVTFEGFENVKLRSREEVKKQLEDFMKYCKSSRKPAIRIIVGEWGEGKTDTFERYIKPKAMEENDYAFLISASTLINQYDVPDTKKLLDVTSLQAVRFLVVLFNAIKEQCKIEEIPSSTSYNNAENYLNDTLNNLIGNNKTRRIYIFIDEFEEVLLYPSRLKEVISGIKETINGMYNQIDEGGKYEGSLHLIIAATPDAFYKLQTDEKTSLIFGGLGRRAGVIELPQISKEEGIRFLLELLKYSYSGNLPTVLPISNLGIFNVLLRVAQNNPGVLVSLFTRLMTSAKVDEKTVKIIDYDHLLKFLEKEVVFVYGGSTACLDKESFSRMLRILEDQKQKEIGDKCSKLFKILVGELKPFSKEELEKRVSHRDDIRNLINIINNILSNREGIGRAILKVCRLSQEKDFHDLVKEFIIEMPDGKYINIDKYFEKLSSFKDRISYYEYVEGKMVEEIFLPCDEQSILSFFEGISEDRAKELSNRIKRKRLCDQEREYYVASDELLSQIYPTPIPRELEFIKNREERLKLWRGVTKNLAKEFENNMPEAFIDLLSKSTDSSLSVIEKECNPVSTGMHICMAKLKRGELKINSLFYPVNGDVKADDIEEVWKLKKDKPYIHCVLLIRTGELTSDAIDKIEDKELGKNGENLILDVQIHPTLAKKIICIYKAEKMPNKIDEKILNTIINRIVTQELSLPKKINEWLKEQEKKGVFVRLNINSTSNLREFADTLRFYINFMEQEDTIENIYSKNQDLLRYTRFGTKKIGLIPDISMPKFKDVTMDLLENGFLTRTQEDKYKVSTHPVERRILNLLSKKRMTLKDIEEYFIIENNRILQDVFLPILLYKGLITIEDGKYYKRVDKSVLLDAVNVDLNKFSNNVQRYLNCSYVYMTKERGERFISLREFELLLCNLKREREKVSEINEELELQKLSLMKRLLEHFFDEIYPLVKQSCENIENEKSNIDLNLKEITNQLDRIKEECNKWFKLVFEKENIEEYKNIQVLVDKASKIYSYTENDIKEEIEKFDKETKKVFSFDKNEKDAYYFNPKLYLLSKCSKEISNIKEKIEKEIIKLSSHFDRLNKKQENVKSSLNSKKITEKYKVSYLISKSMLEQLSKDLIPDIKPIQIPRLKIDEIYGYIVPNINNIEERLDVLSKCIDTLDKLYEKEKEFLDFVEKNASLSSHLLSVFDLESFNAIAKEFDQAVRNVRSQYENLSPNVLNKTPIEIMNELEKLKELIKKLHERLELEKEKVNAIWNEYVEMTNNFVFNTRYIIRILQNIINDDTKIKSIEKDLRELMELVDVQDLEKISKKISELEEKKRSVRSKLYDALKRVLTEEEFLLLELIVGKLKEKKKDWILIEEIYQFVENNLHIEPSKTSEMINKLVQLNILKQGVRLAM